MGYKNTGVVYTTGICCECNKQFRNTNKKLVDKLLNLHLKQSHPNKEWDTERFNINVKPCNNNTTQYSHTVYDKHNQGEEVKDCIKKNVFN